VAAVLADYCRGSGASAGKFEGQGAKGKKQNLQNRVNFEFSLHRPQGFNQRRLRECTITFVMINIHSTGVLDVQE
jgi:hypothetical protein